MSNIANFERIKVFKNKLDAISPTFCTAKWLQSTILLYNGETHSCHHPSRHKIPADSLKDNPKALHNTQVKIQARQDLLNGIQTPECEYCWKIENLGTTHVSDRIYKSAAPGWALPQLDNVVNSGLGEYIEPAYLEVAFESTCNFACMYCTPDVSTRWAEDAESNGPYKLKTITLHDVKWMKSVGKMPIHRDDYNPYIEAFWKWWPELYPKLSVFRITGGEPLLSKHTWKVIDWIKENPNPTLEFAINTNLNVPGKLIERLVREIKSVKNNVRVVKIFTSLEATGKQAEYIRFGLNYAEFIKNLDYVMTELPDVRIVFMTTVNALSASTFTDFLREILKLRAKHYKSAAFSTLGLSVNQLRWPAFQDIRILSDELKKKFEIELRELIAIHKDKQPGFGEALLYLEEIDQLERLISYMNTSLPNIENLREDFKMFFEQYDKRRGLNFHETFPDFEMGS
jgi:organic radical activating enzyme